MYSKELFKKEIKLYIDKNGYEPAHVAKQAYQIYETHVRNIDHDLREKLLDIANMDMGPEFELTEEEFNLFLESI